MSKKCNLTKWCILCRIGENRKWLMFMKYYINNYILLLYDFYIPFPNLEYISRNLDRWIHLPVGSRGRIFVQINLPLRYFRCGGISTSPVTHSLTHHTEIFYCSSNPLTGIRLYFESHGFFLPKWKQENWNNFYCIFWEIFVQI